MTQNPAQRVFRDIYYSAKRKDIVGARAKYALRWYMNNVRQLGQDVSPEAIQRLKSRMEKRIVWGRMYFFKYDPKWSEKLPYYDTFPCVLVVGTIPGKGFHGLNFHYLPPVARAYLLDGLMSVASSDNYDERTKIAVTYEYLQSVSQIKLFQPCFKMYLKSHVRSPFYKINAVEWPIAIFLPVESFEKKSKQAVWSDSMDVR